MNAFQSQQPVVGSGMYFSSNLSSGVRVMREHAHKWIIDPSGDQGHGSQASKIALYFDSLCVASCGKPFVQGICRFLSVLAALVNKGNRT